MKISKKIIGMLTITSIISLFPINSYADQPSVTIDPSFTYEDGLWMPGRVESKDFYISNNREDDISIDRLYLTLESCENWETGEKLDINSKEFKELAKHSTVTLKHDGAILFQDKLKNLLSTKGIKLSKDIDIKSNDKELLNMTIDMDLEMNNDAQALENIFKIDVAYKVYNSSELPVNPDTPNNSDGNINGDSLGKLPQTGGFDGISSLIALGTVAIGSGIILNKKSNKKGGKRHE